MLDMCRNLLAKEAIEVLTALIMVMLMMMMTALHITRPIMHNERLMESRQIRFSRISIKRRLGTRRSLLGRALRLMHPAHMLLTHQEVNQVIFSNSIASLLLPEPAEQLLNLALLSHADSNIGVDFARVQRVLIQHSDGSGRVLERIPRGTLILVIVVTLLGLILEHLGDGAGALLERLEELLLALLLVSGALLARALQLSLVLVEQLVAVAARRRDPQRVGQVVRGRV